MRLKKLYVYLCALCSVLFCDEIKLFDKQVLSLIYENDVFTVESPDRYYTSGFALIYTTGEKDVKQRHHFFQYLDMLRTFQKVDESMVRFSFGITQKIFTPSRRSNVFLRDDRPYAGILSMIAGVEYRRANSLQSLYLYLGAVGKIALGKQTQNTVHRIISTGQWNWNHQIPNDFYLQIIYSYIHHFEFKNKYWDVEPFYHFNIGNYEASAHIGSYLRVGYGLNQSFIPSRFHYGAFAPQIGSKFGVYAFVSARSILVAYNRLITGPTPNFNDLNLNHLSYALEFGGSISYKRFSFTASWIHQGKEFKEQHRFNTYGSFGVSVTF